VPCIAACGGGGSAEGGTGGSGGAALRVAETTPADMAIDVAIDPSGNVLAVWKQTDGTRENIWSNRFE